MSPACLVRVLAQAVVDAIRARSTASFYAASLSPSAAQQVSAAYAPPPCARGTALVLGCRGPVCQTKQDWRARLV